jgi:arylsulfatase A-like enzyme
VTEESTDFHGFLVPLDTSSMLSGLVEPPVPRGSKWFDAFWFGCKDSVAIDMDEATVRTAEQLVVGGLPEPWLLFVALTFPHPPFYVEDPWYSMHDRGAMPPPSPVAGSGKPRFMSALRAAKGLDRLDGDDWAEIVATYYGMVSRVDDQLGRIVDAVDQSGATDRTAVAFFTDHGEYLGDHGLVEKWPAGLDDCLLRNPLVIHVPGFGGGARSEVMVEMVDLLPTLLELGGADATYTHFGQSLVPLLDAPSTSHRAAAFSEGGFVRGEERVIEPGMPGTIYAHKVALQHDDITLVGRAVAMRTPDWTYVYRLYEGDELYDRVEDPQELTNLVDRPAHAARARAMRDDVLAWMVETSDVVPWEHDPRFDAKIFGELFGDDLREMLSRRAAAADAS